MIFFFCLIGNQPLDAQEVEGKNNQFIVLSVDRLATYIQPIFDADIYTLDSSNYRRFKLSYGRELKNGFNVRVGYEFFKDYNSSSNGKNLSSYGQNHRRFQIVQFGFGGSVRTTDRLSLTYEIGYEFGRYSWLDDWHERYNVGANGPGSYDLRYHAITYRYNVIGGTINMGLQYKISAQFFLSTSLGYRAWVSFPDGHKKTIQQVPNFSQSNILQLGYRF